MNPADFWDFSLAVYAKPGVAPQCVALQDRWQLDVNMLLFCLHAGHQGHALTADELQLLDATAAPWRDEVVRPLRAVRRWLKAQASAQEEAQGHVDASELGALRHQTQGVELSAEHCQQLAMAQAVRLARGAPSRAAAAGNLRACASMATAWPDAALAAALAALLDAAFAGDMPVQQARAPLP